MNSVQATLLAICLLHAPSMQANLPTQWKPPIPIMNQISSTADEPYTDVVDCGTVSQADLFRRARLWLVQAAVGEALALSDPQTGDLVGHLKLVVTLPRSASAAGSLQRFRCAVVIECTNRKYRATISRIDLDDDGNLQPISVETYRQNTPAMYAELDKQLKAVLASLQQAVKGYKPF